MACVLRWKSQLSTESLFHIDHLARWIRPFMPAHSHDYAEILFVEKGRGVHEVNGELQPITRGDLILIRPFIDTHCIRDSDPNLSILHVAVRASSVRFLETRYFDANSKFWGGAGKSPMILALSNHQQGSMRRRHADSPPLRRAGWRSTGSCSSSWRPSGAHRRPWAGCSSRIGSRRPAR